MSEASRYRAAFDQQLRIVPPAAAVAVTWLGPLQLVTLERGHGLITHRGLNGTTTAELTELVPAAVDHFRADPTIERLDWKTCAHDYTVDLERVLIDNNFAVGATESILIGATRALAVEVEVPAGVTLRRISDERDVVASEQMQGDVFADPDWRRRVPVMMHQLATGSVEMWIAEVNSQVVTAGRIELAEGTDFANLLGGATRVEWRGRGIYRALTAARAMSALAHGKPLLHSSSTEYSRPILERLGLVKISTTTYFGWQPLGNPKDS